jgi:hypothetical protein
VAGQIDRDQLGTLDIELPKLQIEVIELRGERMQEHVALRVHLDAAVCGERLPQQPPMFCQRGGILLCAELVQQPCRALDVGEKEGDRP